MKHTIASLLLVGVVALAFGAGTTCPTASQDIHHYYDDDGIAVPANQSCFSSPNAPGELDRAGYGVTCVIGSTDCG